MIYGKLQIECNACQIVNGIFFQIYNKNLKICMDTEKTPSSQIWRKKNRVEKSGSLTSDYTLKLHNQNHLVLAQRQNYRLMEQNRKSPPPHLTKKKKEKKPQTLGVN